MIIPDLPYISKFLENTLKETQIPVLKNEATLKLQLSDKLNYYDQANFVDLVKTTKYPMIYSNSENPISWINQHLSFTRLPEYIKNFKDKAYFRSLIKKLYPDFFFRTVSINELEHLDVNSLPMPFIIKPAIGFFSIGVHRVGTGNEWKEVIGKIKREIMIFKDSFKDGGFGTQTIENRQFVKSIMGGDEIVAWANGKMKLN